MIRIVILGAGIGGVPAAYLAKALLGTAAYITVISDKEYFNFVPSNPWVAMGLRSFDEVAFPIEQYLGAHRVRFLPFAAARIEAEKNLIVLSNGEIEKKWLRLSEQLSPIYKWNSGGLKVRRCSQG